MSKLPRVLRVGDAALPRGTLVLLGLAAGVIVTAGMRSAAEIVGPVFLALVSVIAVHPLRGLLQRRLPSWIVVPICLLVVYASLIGLAVALVVGAARFATLLRDYEGQFDARVADLASQLERAGVSSADVRQVIDGLDLSGLQGIVASALQGMLEVVSNLVFILSLVLFMAVDGGSFPARLAAAGEERPPLVAALLQFAHDTRRYLVVSTVFGLIVAALDTAALALLGIPVPLLWGLMAFLTNYIPNIGFIIGLVPPAVLALLEGGPGLMLTVIVIYCVLNLVIQSLIQPKIVGDAVGLSSTLSFLSLVFWTWVIGPLGAVLAIPLSLLVRAVLVDADPASSWLAPLVGGRERAAQPAEDAPRDRPSDTPSVSPQGS
jgi:AI-2 transport protein TqsA